MDREKMVATICDDLESWLERDRQEFLNHVEELERAYLKGMTDKELQGIYEASV
jgi:uncharacterized protein YktA (UPF0223 family)